jgi:phage I-like protein
MAQLSRPFQIAIAGVLVLAGIWVVALRGHSNNSPSASVTVPSTVKPPVATKHHSSAPGVAGLEKDVEKARGAVKTSETNAKQLEKKSEQASSPSSAPSSTPSTSHTSSAPSTTKSHSSTGTKTGTAKHPKSSTPATTKNSAAPAHEQAVEAALSQGKVVLILFWNSKGFDDQKTHSALKQLKGTPGLKLFVSNSSAAQVATYGTITRGIQVFGTPTLLVINHKDEAITLTGLQDSYTIRQAVEEARGSHSF